MCQQQASHELRPHAAQWLVHTDAELTSCSTEVLWMPLVVYNLFLFWLDSLVFPWSHIDFFTTEIELTFSSICLIYMSTSFLQFASHRIVNFTDT